MRVKEARSVATAGDAPRTREPREKQSTPIVPPFALRRRRVRSTEGMRGRNLPFLRSAAEQKGDAERSDAGGSCTPSQPHPLPQQRDPTPVSHFPPHPRGRLRGGPRVRAGSHPTRHHHPLPYNRNHYDPNFSPLNPTSHDNPKPNHRPRSPHPCHRRTFDGVSCVVRSVARRRVDQQRR